MPRLRRCRRDPGSTGQSCISGSRLLVQRSVHDTLVEKVVVAATRRIQIGDPMEKSTNIGPIATAPQFRKIMEYIDVGRSEGATCVLGGGRYTGPGARGEQMVEPTIFTNVRNSMRIAQEEIFGPVLAVIPFDTEQEAVAIANDIPYGLAAASGRVTSCAACVSRNRCRPAWYGSTPIAA